MALEVYFLRCYRERQKNGAAEFPGCFLGLVVSGVEYMHLRFPSGRELHEGRQPVQLSLLPPGFLIEFLVSGNPRGKIM